MLCKGIGEGVNRSGVKARECGRSVDRTQEEALNARLERLRQQHRDLDTAIQSLEETGTGDQLQLRRLKKMKLTDQIQALENKLIPDIIA
jgi:hypothetical protein